MSRRGVACINAPLANGHRWLTPFNGSEFPSGDIRDRQRAFEASIVRARALPYRDHQPHRVSMRNPTAGPYSFDVVAVRAQGRTVNNDATHRELPADARADAVRRFQTWGAVTEPFAEVRRCCSCCSRGRRIEETKTGEYPSTVCSTGINE